MNMQQLPIVKPVSRRRNVGNVERGLSLISGLAMLSYILAKRPAKKISVPMALEAGYMVYRGATGHCAFYQMLEINRSNNGNDGIQAQRAVTINMPREGLFRTWRSLENLPRFMKHIQKVEEFKADNGEKYFHWVANAPMGKTIEWDSKITEEVENEYLAWRSLPGSSVESTGSVHFADAPAGRGTVVTVVMEYKLPAGSMGAAFAKLFGEEPSLQLREDLRHFKQMMETGEIPSVEEQSSGRNKNFERTISYEEPEKDEVDEASDESFPASDPPAWISSHRKERSRT